MLFHSRRRSEEEVPGFGTGDIRKTYAVVPPASALSSDQHRMRILHYKSSGCTNGKETDPFPSRNCEHCAAVG